MNTHDDAHEAARRYPLSWPAGWKRTPPGNAAADWRQVFGFTATEPVTVERMNAAFKQRAAASHPDKGGTDVEMAHINRAREYAMQDLLG